MAVNGFDWLNGATIEKRRKSEGVGLDTVGKHLSIVRKCLVV